jgi:exopolysaccharide production protein ExoZ
MMTTDTREGFGSSATVLVSIQWLRAIAAVLVVVFHGLYYSNTLTEQFGQPPIGTPGFAAWWFGFHIFFVVSGFIMIHTTRDFGAPGAPKRFLLRRVVRVVPLYWLLTIPLAIGALLAPQAFGIETNKYQYVLSSFFFIRVARAGDDLRPLLGQGWTLDYEMFFYVAFALALLLPRRWGVGALTVIFAGLVILGRAFSIGPDSPILFTFTDDMILEFLFGVYIGLAYETGWRIPGWAAAVAVLAGFVWVAPDPSGPTFLINGLPAALVVSGFVLGPRLNSSAGTRWLEHIGDASYSLYLTHTFILLPYRKLWAAVVGDHLPVALYLVSSVAIAILLALVVYRYVERPMTLFLRHRFAERTVTTRADVPAAAI